MLHLSFVLVFASYLYFATEVLACIRETDCVEVFWLRKCLRGETEELPFFLSIGMTTGEEHSPSFHKAPIIF